METSNVSQYLNATIEDFPGREVMFANVLRYDGRYQGMLSGEARQAVLDALDQLEKED